MKKIIILLMAGFFFFSCSKESSAPEPVAEHVLIGNLFYDLYEDNTAEVVKDDSYYDSLSGELTFPSTVNYNGEEYSVTRIGDRAFSCDIISEDCPTITSVSLPNSVTSIGNYAFYGCGLTSPLHNEHVFAYMPRSYSGAYTIPKGIEQIAGGAFSGCEGLTSISIPNSVTSIGDDAFYGCESLTDPVYNEHAFAYLPKSYKGAYTIPKGIEQIAGGAFVDCKSLTSVTLPNSVTSIGVAAFWGCESLSSITIPNSVTSIGIGAFGYCPSLKSITIPDGVTEIAPRSFEGCSSLTSVTIPNSVKKIGNDAFNECKSLTSITIPNSVKSIGWQAFLGCSSLTSVTLPNSVTSIGDAAFRGCEGLTSITIPDGVTEIAPLSFLGCSSLTSVTIPNGVTSIGIGAFGGCSSLTSVAIPRNVTRIEERAFEGCTSLTAIDFPNSAIPIGDRAFWGCGDLDLDCGGDYSKYVYLPDDRYENEDYHMCDVIITRIQANGTVTLIYTEGRFGDRHDQVVDPSAMQDLLVDALMKKSEAEQPFSDKKAYYLIIEKDDAVSTTDPVYQTVVKQYIKAVRTLRENLSLRRYDKKFGVLNDEQRSDICRTCPSYIIGMRFDDFTIVEDDVETDAIEISSEDEMEELIQDQIEAPEEEEEDVVFIFVEQMPEFPGGQQALFKYLSENVKYPTIAQENGIQGKVVCQFTVNKDGSIADVQVTRSSGEVSLDKEAVRVVKAMPNWKPGQQRGKPVRVKYTVPVNFKLQ